MIKLKSLFLALGLCSLLLSSHSKLLAQAKLTLDDGERICFIGNELGERMQHHNFWESILYQRFPNKSLVVRNLCFAGDEVHLRIRSKNFGTPHDHLTHSKATTVFFFFGFNESFNGVKGLETFKSNLRTAIKETQAQKYDGKKAPKIVLISPIAFENTGDRNLPNGKEHNKRLKAYTEAILEVGKSEKVISVDVFSPTLELFEKTDTRLTLNGAHLNEAGYRLFGEILEGALFGGGTKRVINKKLKAEIDDKNFHWWHRYRAVNGFSIYGDRGKAGNDGTYNNRDVMERERAILDQMCANRDQRIWKLAQGKEVAAKVDDSNTLPFFKVKTNVGGKNDPNRKRGKLGSLDYLSSEEQLKLFEMGEGYQINLVASEEKFPELANPVALNFDNKGRLWVATMPSYPHWKPKTKMDDKILIFEDTDGDGKADKKIVFADGLHQPTGFEIGYGGAFVAEQPDVLFLQDTDGDDKADVRIRLLKGFCSADSHHGLAAFEWGPDGGLYFQEGTFKYSQVESPYGLTRLQEGGTWRYDVKTKQFKAHVSLTFSNPWGYVFDRWGQDFIGDASPGNGYWATPISGHVAYPDKHPGGGHHRRLHKETGGGEGYGPKYRFPTFYKKRTRPLAGCAILSSRHFPEDVQGNFLVTNCIGDRMVLNHKIEEQESGFHGTEIPPIVSCKDGNFRPVDVQVAPDGSIYIVDWHNALIGHLQHNLRDPSRDHSHGRIWRVTHKTRPLLKPAKIDGAPVVDLVKLLEEPEDRTRYRARRELSKRKTEEVIAAVKKWLNSQDPSKSEFEHRRLEALWMHQTHNVVDKKLLNAVLTSKDHRARAAGIRVLSYWLDRVDNPHKLLKAGVNDAHPRVRIEAVRALSFLPGDKSMEIALEVLEKEMDKYLQYTLDETMRTLEKSLEVD